MSALSAVSVNDQTHTAINFYQANSCMDEHEHDIDQLSIIVSGSLLESTRLGSHQVDVPSICFKPATLLHADHYGQKGAFIVSFNTDVNLLDEVNSKKPDYLWQPIDSKKTKSLLQTTLQAVMNHSTNILADNYWDILALYQQSAPINETTQPHWLKCAKNLIHDSYDPINLSQLAIDQGIHPVHFSRTFKKFYLYSPSEYQQKLLISRALHFLKHGFSLIDCAAEVGYADQSHMTRAFNKHLGLPPNKLKCLFTQ